MESESTHNPSEVARIRAQIEQECQALQFALHAPAIVSSHASISRKYKALDIYCHLLALHVGPEEATRIAVDTYTSIVQ